MRQFKRLVISREISASLTQAGQEPPEAIYGNEVFEVWVYAVDPGNGFPPMKHLSIKRYDRDTIRDWRTLMAIKNAILGAECEAVEVFPAASREVDTANQYHLFGFADPKVRWPFGYDMGRVVFDDDSVPEELQNQINKLTRTRFDRSRQRDLKDPAPLRTRLNGYVSTMSTRVDLDVDTIRQHLQDMLDAEA